MIVVMRARYGDDCSDPGEFYIGRPSVLGNPFKIGPDGTREDVVVKYRDWLEGCIRRENQFVLDELRRIALAAAAHAEVRLFCFCAPLPCHGDVIKAVVEKYLDTGQWSVRV